MANTLGMNGRKRIAGLTKEPRHSARRKAVGRDCLAQGLAFNEFHDQVGDVHGGLAVTVNAHHIGMDDCFQCGHFMCEALGQTLISYLAMKDFDGTTAILFLILAIKYFFASARRCSKKSGLGMAPKSKSGRFILSTPGT